MRKIVISYKAVIKIFDWEISKHSSICELMTIQINLSSIILVMNIIFSPFCSFPSLGFESNRKWSCHLDCSTNSELWSCFM